MDFKTIKRKYKFDNDAELLKYHQWCREQGWQPGTGRPCDKTCKYRLSHNNTVDRICNYLTDNGKRRPCPPWDCTAYEKGKRRRTFDGSLQE